MPNGIRRSGWRATALICETTSHSGAKRLGNVTASGQIGQGRTSALSMPSSSRRAIRFSVVMEMRQ
ncbi:MAG: hypothetical protein ACUVTL_08045 [Thermoproteota archaeon]